MRWRTATKLHTLIRITLWKDQWSSHKSKEYLCGLIRTRCCSCDACSKLMTTAHRLKKKKKKKEAATRSHKSVSECHSITYKKKYKKEEEDQVTISVWHRILPIFAQTAHYAWVSSARPSNLWTSYIWQFCNAQFCARNIGIYEWNWNKFNISKCTVLSKSQTASSFELWRERNSSKDNFSEFYTCLIYRLKEKWQTYPTSLAARRKLCTSFLYKLS